MKRFTICCLFYGNHPELAGRLLRSLDHPGWFDDIDIRVGLNHVSAGIHQLVDDFSNVIPITDIHMGNLPYHKYPLMRRMFHEQSIATPYTMWFDDDSWVLPAAPRGLEPTFNRSTICRAAGAGSIGETAWLELIEEKLRTHGMIGAPYFKHLRGMQHQFIEDQPWYNGKTVKHRQRVDFITGGWWAIRTRILHQHDWPPANFEHNGGDVMLGELCRQHEYKIGRFTTGLAINASESGKCSSAKRRGFSQDPIGVDYVRPRPEPRPVPTLFDVLDGKHAP